MDKVSINKSMKLSEHLASPSEAALSHSSTASNKKQVAGMHDTSHLNEYATNEWSEGITSSASMDHENWPLQDRPYGHGYR